MHRRKLLGAVGLGATGVAGLLGTRGRGAGQDTETTTTTGTTAATTTTTAEDGFTGIDSSADRPFAQITVGTQAGVRNPNNNRPHLVRVWNDSEESRPIGLALTRSGGNGQPAVDRAVEFPADGYLTIRLLEPASYRLLVRAGGATPTEVEILRARFDCNDSRTDVAVTSQGQVKSTTVTTEVGCSPEVTDRTFTAFAGSCGSANRARVSFAEASVTVRGSIRTPNPCYGARLAEVAVADADTLRLTVTPTEPTADVCAQCVGTVGYRAELAFRDRAPGTVEVVHNARDASETVSRATQGAGGTTAETTGGTTTDGTTSGTTIDGTTTPST